MDGLGRHDELGELPPVHSTARHSLEGSNGRSLDEDDDSNIDFIIFVILSIVAAILLIAIIPILIGCLVIKSKRDRRRRTRKASAGSMAGKPPKRKGHRARKTQALLLYVVRDTWGLRCYVGALGQPKSSTTTTTQRMTTTKEGKLGPLLPDMKKTRKPGTVEGAICYVFMTEGNHL
ncbi:hypothetical protein NECAME_17156 [Necator americanus]|uniref:Uncharacterized protein n=1 Tax=Necator americanus TaxID=51031 RepID=W2TRC3_NECAM|nr:hypothetical protein NECAME_17156 [Necator americanus]ETN84328.1 hypothetical protein NECAME_17156 [Necator americanus]